MTLTCVSVSHADWFDVIDSALAAKSQGADIIEIRMDHLKGSISASTLDTLVDLRRDADLPMIVTIRPEREGGGYKGNEEERIGLLKEVILRGFEYIDLELRMDGLLRQELIKVAKEKNVKTIISYHDYNKTPSYSELLKKVTECQNVKGDYAKVAVYNHSIEDAYNVLLAAHKAGSSQVPCIVMGMGVAGYITRFMAPYVGCKIVYSSLDSQRKVEEGQIPISILKELWKFLELKKKSMDG
jgi:3-dehydroquinate dehydratase-1